MSYTCPECEHELVDREFRVMYTESDTEVCWICINKECQNYQEVVFDSGDIYTMEQERIDDERFEESRMEKENEK